MLGLCDYSKALCQLILKKKSKKMDLQKNHFLPSTWLVLILGFSFLLFVGSYKKSPRKEVENNQKKEIIIENEADKKETEDKKM